MMGRRARIHGLPFRAFCVRHPTHTLTVAETGLGIENATRVFLRMLQAGRFDAVISLGYCGALSPDASVGDLIWASRVRLIEGERVETLFLPDERKLLETLPVRLPIRAGTFFTLKGWMKKQELGTFCGPRHGASRMRDGDVRPGAALPAPQAAFFCCQGCQRRGGCRPCF